MNKRVSIILPSYNESIALPLLIEHIIAILDCNFVNKNYEIIVVDDNSPDATSKLIENKFFDKENVKVLVRKNEKGLGSAILHGIRNASGDYIVVLDSDFNHPPRLIPELIKKIENYDMVVYTRYIKGGGMNTENKLFRYWGSKLYNKFLQIYLNLKTTDNLCGFFIIRKEDVFKLPVDIIFAGYGEFYFGILYFMHRISKDNILELPIIYEKRLGGESKTNFSPLMKQYFKKARMFKGYFKDNISNLNNV